MAELLATEEPPEPPPSKRQRTDCHAEVMKSLLEHEMQEEAQCRLEMQGGLAMPDEEKLQEARELLQSIRVNQAAMTKCRADLDSKRGELVAEGERFGKAAALHRELVAKFERLVEERLRAESYASRPIEKIRERNLCSEPTCGNPIAFVPENCPHGFCILHTQPYVFDERTRLTRCMHCQKSLGPRRFEDELGDQLFSDGARLAAENGVTFSYEREFGSFRIPLWIGLAAPPHHPTHTLISGKFCRRCHETFHAMATDDSDDSDDDLPPEV